MLKIVTRTAQAVQNVNFTKCTGARDQHSIFSMVQKFCPDYWLLLELHALTLVTRSYAFLLRDMANGRPQNTTQHIAI